MPFITRKLAQYSTAFYTDAMKPGGAKLCGRGWVGTKGQCKRAKRGTGVENARKQSAIETAKKIKAEKAAKLGSAGVEALKAKTRQIIEEKKGKSKVLSTPSGQGLLFSVSEYAGVSDKLKRSAQNRLKGLKTQLGDTRASLKNETDPGQIAKTQGKIERMLKQRSRLKRIAEGTELPSVALRGTEKESAPTGVKSTDKTIRMKRVELSEIAKEQHSERVWERKQRKKEEKQTQREKDIQKLLSEKVTEKDLSEDEKRSVKKLVSQYQEAVYRGGQESSYQSARGWNKNKKSREEEEDAALQRLKNDLERTASSAVVYGANNNNLPFIRAAKVAIDQIEKTQKETRERQRKATEEAKQLQAKAEKAKHPLMQPKQAKGSYEDLQESWATTLADRAKSMKGKSGTYTAKMRDGSTKEVPAKIYGDFAIDKGQGGKTLVDLKSGTIVFSFPSGVKENEVAYLANTLFKDGFPEKPDAQNPKHVAMFNTVNDLRNWATLRRTNNKPLPGYTQPSDLPVSEAKTKKRADSE